MENRFRSPARRDNGDDSIKQPEKWIGTHFEKEVCQP